MTLIAHIAPYNAPAMIGDLLLSSKTMPTKEVAVPVSRDINRKVIHSKGRATVGLTQKLNLVGERMAVAWSGKYEAAKSFLGMLEPFASLPEIDPELVRNVVRNLDAETLNALYLIILIVKDNDGSDAPNYEVIANRANGTFCGPFADVHIAGNGTRAFQDLLNQFGATRVLLPPPNDRPFFSMQSAVAMSAELGGYEIFSDDTIKNGWGGGFEVAYLEDGLIKKVGNRLHLFFKLVPSEQEGPPCLRLLPYFNKVDYWHDALVVRAIQHEFTKRGQLDQGREDIFLLTPIAKDAGDYDLSDFQVPPLLATTICCYVINELDGGKEALVHVVHDSSGLDAFRYQFLDKHIQISIKNGLIMQLQDLVQQRCGVEPIFSQIGY